MGGTLIYILYSLAIGFAIFLADIMFLIPKLNK